MAVPYIPVQGSPGVFWESWGVGDMGFGRVIIICSVEVTYMRVGGLMGWQWRAVRVGMVLTT